MNRNFYLSALKMVGITVHAMKSIELMDKNELKVLYEKHGQNLEGKLDRCEVCQVELDEYNTAMNRDGSIRLDSRGKPWCQKCTSEFDSIDWSR